MTMAAPPKNVQWGTRERKTRYGDGSFPCHADRFEIMPRKDWQSVSLRPYVRTVYSQLDGMCTSNGGASLMMIDRQIRRPDEPQPILSPEFLYGLHSKWGQGSSLDDNLWALIDEGICTRETVPQNKWRPSDWPGHARDEARNYRVHPEGFVDLDGLFDAVATALQLGFPSLIGVRWPSGGYHAVACTELDRRNRGWRLGGPNSWGARWNGDGFYWLEEGQCVDMRRVGAWALMTTTE